MKKTFQKTLLAAAAGVALMGAASANSLLFPYFTTASGAQSVLSISGGTTLAGPEALHYVYNYGTSCTHYDGYGYITRNDLLQHSVASPAAGGFGMAVPSDGSTPFYFPLNSAGNNFGFLTVSTKTTPTALISGEMIIVDPTTGMAVSYAGASNNITDTTGGSEGDYSGFITPAWNLSFFGTGVTTTSWYGVVLGNMYPAIAANRNWRGSQTVRNNGIVYNNDENPFSGTATKRVDCATSFTPANLMTTAQQAAVGVNGGLIHAFPTANATLGDGVTPADPSTGLWLMKIQTVLPAVGAPFAGKTFLHTEQANAW